MITLALTQDRHVVPAALAFTTAEAFLKQEGWPDWDIRFMQQRDPDGYTIEVYGLSGEWIGCIARTAA